MLRSHSRIVTSVSLVGGLLLFVAAGCGESDQEAAFRKATDSLTQAHELVAEARALVAEHEEQVSEAEGELTGARVELADAQVELADAQARVGLYATDDVLFRAVQLRLLEDETLEGVAIAAQVEKGVVILSGFVPQGSLRDHAGELALGVPGVADVDNRIQVDVSAPPE